MAFADFGKKLGNLAQNTVEKSKSLAEITKLNIANGNLEDEIKKTTLAVGQYVLENNLLGDDETVAQYAARVQELNASIQANNDQVQALKSQNTCPSCGSNFSNNSKFCEKCGTPRPEAPQAAPAPAPAADPALCPNCGTAFDGDTTFCGECGAKRPE